MIGTEKETWAAHSFLTKMNKKQGTGNQGAKLNVVHSRVAIHLYKSFCINLQMYYVILTQEYFNLFCASWSM